MKKIVPVFGLILIITLVILTRQTYSNALVSPDIQYAYFSPTPTPQILKKIDWIELEANIQSIIAEKTPKEKKWVIGLKITDLKTGEELAINDKEVFDAASVGKLPILLMAYEQIQSGVLARDKKVTIAEEDMQYYGTGSIQYKKAPMEYTIKELIDLMIKQSDNTATYVVASTVGRDNIKNFAQKINMKNTDTKENNTTPEDVNTLLRYLYTDIQKNNKELYNEIIETMKSSVFEDRLPVKLPKEVEVAHKIGTGTAQIHDAGIVLLVDRPFSITVFTKNINDEEKAKSVIADIALTTYTSFTAVK